MLSVGTKRGFTLIEFMIVVSIVGLLASISIPTFINYLTTVKASEVPLNMSALAQGEMDYIGRPRVHPATSEELYRCWQVSLHLAPQNGVLLTRKVGWTEFFPPYSSFGIIGFAPTSGLYYTYALDNRLFGENNFGTSGLDADGYCMDSSLSMGHASLSNEPLRIVAVGATEDSPAYNIYGRIITATNGVPSAGPLVFRQHNFFGPIP